MIKYAIYFVLAAGLLLGCKAEVIDIEPQHDIVCVDSVHAHLVPIVIVGRDIIVDVGGWLTNEGNCYLIGVDVEFRLLDEHKNPIVKWIEYIECDFEPKGRAPIDLEVYEHKATFVEATIKEYYW